MAIDILMPALSPTMEQGKLAKWLKKEGDKVKPGDVLAEIETDKATMEVEAIDEGVLAKILVSDGTDNVAVNTPIAVLAGEGEDVSAAASSAQGARRSGAGSPAGADARHAGGGHGGPPGARRASAARIEPVAEPGGAVRDHEPHQLRRHGGDPGGHRDGQHDRPRGPSRRHGGGDAQGRERLRHGRGGRRVPGRLQGHAGPAAGIRRPARHRHADHRARLCRRRRRRGLHGPAPDRRVHDLQLRHAGDRPHHQLGGQDPLHVRRPARRAHRVPRPERRRGPRRRAAQPGLCGLVLERARPQGRRALYGVRRQGPAQERHPRSEPGDLPRERDPLRPVLPGAEARRLHGADRQGAHPSRGQGRHHRVLLASA